MSIAVAEDVVSADGRPTPQKWTMETSDKSLLTEHPTLQRSYSTIGIGPVFASPLPDHPLPHQYLPARHSSQNTSKVVDDFLSTELVGIIKSEPRDFIVREIAPAGRNIVGLVAEDGFNEDSLRVADLHSVRQDLSREEEKEKTLEVAAANHGRTIVSLDKQQYLPNAMEVMEQQLRLTSMGLEASMAAIRELDAAADSMHNANINCELSPEQAEVWITPLCSDNNVQFDRSLFHRAFRHEFPLLTAETVRQPVQSTSQSMEHRIRITIDDRFRVLIPLLDDPCKGLRQLYAYFKRKVNRSNLNETINLVIKKDLPREERRIIHQAISNQTQKSLTTSTITDYQLQDGTLGVAVAVQWSKNACRRAVRKVQRDQIGADVFPHTLFVLKKTQKEHLVVLQTLQRAFKVGLPDIGLAGIKDMHAVTYQFATLAYTTPPRLMQQADFLKDHGIEIGSALKVDWRLNKGDLDGNRFDIVIRNMCRVNVTGKDGLKEEHFEQADMSHMERMVDRVRHNGFVNFYGTQRVGEPGPESIVGVRGFDIGRAMLQQDYGLAIDLLMTGRSLCRGDEVESEAIRAVRETWRSSNGDVNLTYKKIPRNSMMTRERIVLQGLKRHGKGNPLAALRCLGYNERIFWVSAYQSYVFNVMTTKRLQYYGTRVVPGDLVVSASDGHVEIVTSESLTQYSINEVVLPLPGHGIMYPTNEIGVMYKQFLEKEGISFIKDNVPAESTAKGCYRHIIREVRHMNCLKIDEGDGLVVRLSFELPAGSYATMVLREVMLTTVARV